MSHHREPVTALGAPAAVGPYSHAVRAGGLLFCSGQIAARPGESGELVGDDACRAGAALPGEPRGGLRRGGRGARRRGPLTVYVTDMGAFAEVNEAYAAFFDGDPPARVAIGVAALPKGAQVEIDAVVALCPADERDVRASPPRTSGAPARRSPTWCAARRCCRRPRSASAAAATVVLKAENLQRTGSFKLRGALSKLAALGEGCARGVVAGSAGNHARALADAARARGVPCEVFMPGAGADRQGRGAARWARSCAWSATGRGLLVAARARAEEAGMAFVHPFDDPTWSPARARSGSSCSRTSPDLAKVVVPVGGGGLASGVAIAVKSARPEVRGGRRAGRGRRAVPGVAGARRAGAVVDPALTIADGIAVKRPGELTLGLVRRWLDEVVVVGEDDVAEAMVLLLERPSSSSRAPAPSASRRCWAATSRPPRSGTTSSCSRGGNVDAGLLAEVARRHETEAGRRLVAASPACPTGRARWPRCWRASASAGANLVEVEHMREGVDLHVRETAVQLVLETRGREHAAQVQRAIGDAGYEARVVH